MVILPTRTKKLQHVGSVKQFEFWILKIFVEIKVATCFLT